MIWLSSIIHLLWERLVMSCSLLLFASLLSAQPLLPDTISTPSSWRYWLADLSEMEDFESTRWEDYEEDMEEMSQHPINLNTATREELSRFPFLSAQQVEDIQAYLYRYGGMKSLGELAMIPSISWQQRQLLGSFVYVSTENVSHFPTLQNIARYGKHELVGMVKIPFYDRKGDVNGYSGYKYKHGVRYQFRYGDYVKLGLLGAQDAGEPFGGGKNKLGYDFYSFYLQVRKLGRWKNITLGRYRLHEGLGLVLNNDFSFGKLSVLSSLAASSATQIRVHSSRSSANYLQGAVATYSILRGLDLTAFFSYRQIDATLNDDGTIRTILKTGLHRTQSEIRRQDVASNTLMGGHINYRLGGWHVGATAFFTSFSRPLKPTKSQLYKRFAPEGDKFWNASIDYGYISHRWNIAGETATGYCGAIATLHSVSYLFSDKFSLLGLHRFYSARYYSLFSNAFAEGSDVQDENGVYLGFNWMPARRWSIFAYSDFAHFAWPKYQTKTSTQSWDSQVNILYQPSRYYTLGARLRYKERAGTRTDRCRCYVSMQRKNWNARTSLDYVMSQKEERSQGYMVSENLGYQWRWLRLAGSLGYFHTSDYESRIFVYEPGLLYQMSFGNYYGEGMRYALVARSEIGRHLLLITKLGITDYFDRDHISSGYQEIVGSSQTDLEIQLKWKW